MILGTGGSLSTSGSGTITATAVPATGVTGLTASRAVVTNGSSVLTTIAYATSATASTFLQRDANANSLSNINFMATASITSAGGTTVLTAASPQYQYLTGSSNQTFQLPDATTLLLGPSFIFNNNSSGSLTIVNNASTTIYIVPAGGVVYVALITNGTAAGVWDAHPEAPSTVQWGSGTTGLVMNSVLSTTPAISAGTPSSTVPAFIPQRGSSTTGWGGTSTALYGIISGTAAYTATTSTFVAAGAISGSNLSGTNTGDQTITLTGEATGSGTGSFAVTLTNSSVIGKVLTGFVSGAGTVSAADSILQAFQKVVGNITALVTGVSSVFGRTGAVTAQSGDYTAAQVGLGNVTNDTQTKASIVPNTVPSAGQILVGNAGGTAYAPSTLSGSGATVSLASTGVMTISSIANASLSNSTISGIALGGTLGALTATDTTLTFSGSYTGATARTVGLNLGNANTWAALQTFGTNISIGGVTATGATGTGNVVFSASPTFTGTLTAVTGTFSGVVSSAVGTSSGNVSVINGVQTITNKRITQRVLALSANSATPAINTDSYDVVHITAQTAAITSFTSGLTGTPVDGDRLRTSITGTGSGGITWGSSFESSGNVTLPSGFTTTRLDVGFFWNTETNKWRCVAVA